MYQVVKQINSQKVKHITIKKTLASDLNGGSGGVGSDESTDVAWQRLLLLQLLYQLFRGVNGRIEQESIRLEN